MTWVLNEGCESLLYWSLSHSRCTLLQAAQQMSVVSVSVYEIWMLFSFCISVYVHSIFSFTSHVGGLVEMYIAFKDAWLYFGIACTQDGGEKLLNIVLYSTIFLLS